MIVPITDKRAPVPYAYPVSRKAALHRLLLQALTGLVGQNTQRQLAIVKAGCEPRAEITVSLWIGSWFSRTVQAPGPPLST